MRIVARKREWKSASDIFLTESFLSESFLTLFSQVEIPLYIVIKRNGGVQFYLLAKVLAVRTLLTQ